MFYDLIAQLRATPPQRRSDREMAWLLGDAVPASLDGAELPVRRGGYTRTLLYADDRFEVLLLNWSAAAVSSIHDHGGQRCWLAVLQGQLQIENFERRDACAEPGFATIRRTGGRVMWAGDLDVRSGPFDIHRVAAGARSNALTLHVYAGPLRSYLTYDEGSGRCAAAYGTYDFVFPAQRRAAAG